MLHQQRIVSSRIKLIYNVLLVMIRCNDFSAAVVVGPAQDWRRKTIIECVRLCMHLQRARILSNVLPVIILHDLGIELYHVSLVLIVPFQSLVFGYLGLSIQFSRSSFAIDTSKCKPFLETRTSIGKNGVTVMASGS